MLVAEEWMDSDQLEPVFITLRESNKPSHQSMGVTEARHGVKGSLDRCATE